ncbi:MAG: holo-ACP synthase [Erysipelotrichaceae bacterium]
MIAGIGCDIVAIDRFRDKTIAFAKRVLTPEELTLYEALTPARKPEWLAGRFAAKEAIVKAIDKNLPITQIAVLSTSDGKPVCELAGFTILVSISHEKEFAIAYAIAQTSELV